MDKDTKELVLVCAGIFFANQLLRIQQNNKVVVNETKNKHNNRGGHNRKNRNRHGKAQNAKQVKVYRNGIKKHTIRPKKKIVSSRKNKRPKVKRVQSIKRRYFKAPRCGKIAG